MKNYIAKILFIAAFWIGLVGYNFSFSQNLSPELSHIDFLPKYLKQNTNILIARIDYFPTKMILHFRLLIDKKDTIRFYGKQHQKAWIMQSGSSVGRNSSNNIQKTGDVCNIRINDQLKASWLPANQDVYYTPERGDIVSCEIHVERMPHFIKVVSFVGGDVNISKDPVFLLSNLMIKSSDHNQLGNLEQMETIVDNYYKEFDYIRYPNLKYLSSIENEQLTKEDVDNISPTPIKETMAPVNYMPKLLDRVEDLKCKERIILRNVYFEDNSFEFTRRILAMRTISIVYDYLNYYPDSKIVLHGHTDVYGNPYENLVLSKERVLAVKRVLTQKGIDKHRIITLYHGGEQPLPNCEKGHELNRRVEVELVCEEKVISTVKN